MCWGLAFISIISRITVSLYEHFAGLSGLSMDGCPWEIEKAVLGSWCVLCQACVGQAGGTRMLWLISPAFVIGAAI